MAPRVDQRHRPFPVTLDSPSPPLDAAPDAPDVLDVVDADAACEEPTPTDVHHDTTEHVVQPSLWDLAVPPAPAAAAIPVGGPPSLGAPTSSADLPRPFPPEPAAVRDLDPGPDDFDPFGDAPGPRAEAHLTAALFEPVVYEPDVGDPPDDRNRPAAPEPAPERAPGSPPDEGPRETPSADLGADEYELPQDARDEEPRRRSFEPPEAPPSTPTATPAPAPIPAAPDPVKIVARFDDLAPAHDEPAGAPISDAFDAFDPHENASPAVESIPRSVLYSEALSWAADLPRWTRRGVAGLAAVVVLVVGVISVSTGSGDSDDAPAAAAPAPVVETSVNRVARAVLPLVDVYEDPGEGTVLTTLRHPAASGAPLVFLVEGEWEEWLKVQIPAPPAGTTGWVRASDVEVSDHEVHITIDVHDRLLIAREGGDIVLRAPIALGRMDAPEPGRSFVTDRLALTNPTGGYGSHALPLAGYENGDETIFRGQGLVAIHGTDDPVSLGQTVPKGSVALANDDARVLYETAPLGTPVEVIDSGADLAADG